MVVPTWSGCQVKLTRGITPLAIFDAPCTVQNVICSPDEKEVVVYMTDGRVWVYNIHGVKIRNISWN